MNPTRVLFIGTDKFANPTLAKLIEFPQYDVKAVVTQPDRPVGRKQIITPPDVKEFLISRGYNIEENGSSVIKLFQPEKIKEAAEDILAEVEPQLVVVVAYGQILPTSFLEKPKYSALNVHASLLPSYRGAVPIEAALLDGAKKTGVSILKVTPGLDDGPVLAELPVEIESDDDAVKLRSDLAERGADLLIDILPRWIDGTLQTTDQDKLAVEKNRKVSTCKVSDMSREKAEIKPTDKVKTAWNKVRAFSASKGAWMNIQRPNGKSQLKIWKAEVASNTRQLFGWGKISYDEGRLVLTLPNGKLHLKQVQLAGKNRAMGKDYKFLASEKQEQVRALIQYNDEILVIRRHKFGRDYVVLPGGHLHNQETEVEGLVREVKEETNIVTEPEQYEHILTMPDGLEEILHVYKITLEERPDNIFMSGDEVERQTEENRYELAWINQHSVEFNQLMPPGLREKLGI
jgi:methionyl-tRNA formyltransferase